MFSVETTAASSSNSSYFTFEAPWLPGMECTMTFPLLSRVQGTRMTDRRNENTKPKLLQKGSCAEATAPHLQVLLPAIWKLVTMARPGKQHHLHYLTISVTPITSRMFCGLLITVNSSYTTVTMKVSTDCRLTALRDVMLSAWMHWAVLCNRWLF